jgi:amidase
MKPHLMTALGLLALPLTPLGATPPDHFLSARETARQIRNGTMSSEAAVSEALRRVADKNSALNAVVTLNPLALEQARVADAAVRAGGPLGPLHGVPIVVKDTYSTAGILTMAGYPALKNYVPKEDSVVVGLLRKAGAIIVGKGNTPTLAMDMQTDNPIFGRTNNPWNMERTSGGSTGGDTVAVATGMAALGFGSDLAGSLRIPTAYCGIYGLKTTYGVVSKIGHVPPLPGAIDGLHSLAVLGPVARSIDDLRLALQVIALPDPRDRTVVPLLPEPVTPKPVTSLRVAWVDSFGGVPVSAEIRARIRAFAAQLEAAGAQVEQAEPKNFPYEQVWETWGGLVAHQGGYDVPDFARALGEFFAAGSVKNIPHQRQIIGTTSVAKYMTLLTRQRDYSTQLENFLDNYDLWLCPVSSTTAFDHLKPTSHFGDFSVYDTPLQVDGQKVPYYVATQSYTTLFAVTENPVVTLPLGLDSQGLPIGVQLVGKRYADYALLQAAESIDLWR